MLFILLNKWPKRVNVLTMEYKKAVKQKSHPAKYGMALIFLNVVAYFICL